MAWNWGRSDSLLLYKNCIIFVGCFVFLVFVGNIFCSLFLPLGSFRASRKIHRFVVMSLPSPPPKKWRDEGRKVSAAKDFVSFFFTTARLDRPPCVSSPKQYGHYLGTRTSATLNDDGFINMRAGICGGKSRIHDCEAAAGSSSSMNSTRWWWCGARMAWHGIEWRSMAHRHHNNKIIISRRKYCKYNTIFRLSGA